MSDTQDTREWFDKVLDAFTGRAGGYALAAGIAIVMVTMIAAGLAGARA